MQEQLKAAHERAKQFAETIKQKLGYDTVTLYELHIKSAGTLEGYYLVDDAFQKGLNFGHQVQNSAIRVDINAADLTKFFSREERELRVLAAQSGETKTMQAELASAAGRKYASQIVSARDELARQIPDWSKS